MTSPPGRAEPSGEQERLRAELHAPFRARRGRIVGWTAAFGQAAALILAAIIVPWNGPLPFSWYDRAAFVVLAAVIGWFLTRLADVSATPSETGLVVRNVLLSRTLDWAQIVSVRFAGGDPWVTLDLSDADTLAVMAIQRADGDRGAAEARRLATLLALHAPRTDH
jgi:MFS family permease